MASGTRGAVVRRLDRLFGSGTATGLTEGQLLDRFVTRNDASAFEVLVERHGPMVLTVCRQWLRDPNDVDDAFQATFLVLVRKAGSIRKSHVLGSWLYGVAYRVAARARANTLRKRSRETPLEGVEPSLAAVAPIAEPELHEEVRRLPEKYRAPVVLCYLEGLTHEEAAERLQWPVGSVKGRLARARDLLRSRLTRRGIALATSSLLVDQLTKTARAFVPAALMEPTIRAATLVAANTSLTAAAGVLSARALGLTEGVLSAMSLTKLKLLAISFVTAGCLTTGTGVLAYQLAQPANPAKPEAQQSEPKAAPAPAAETEKTIDDEFEKYLANLTASNDAKYVQGAHVYSINMRNLFAQGKLAATPERIREARAGHLDRMERLTAAIKESSLPAKTKAKWLTQTRASEREAFDSLIASDPPAPPPPGDADFGAGGMGGGIDPSLDPDNLRIQLPKLARRVSALDKSPRTKAILKKLEEPLSMNFAKETPFEEVLKYIRAGTQGPNDNGIAIYIDPGALEDNDKTMASPIKLDLEGIPLKMTLRLLLKQIGLSYCVRDGLLFISTPEGVAQELREAESELSEDAAK